MAVLVEIGDDEQPVEPPKVRKDTRGPLCREACDLCAMPDFQTWAMREFPSYSDGGSLGARAAILEVCGVESRKELDLDEDSGNAFVTLVRIPFIRYQRASRE
jgi:hypothetical protein